MFKRVRRKLREIRHHSRRVERNAFDRAQSIGFVVSAFVAPAMVYAMNEWYVRDRVDVLLLVRVTISIQGNTLDAVVISQDPNVRAAPMPYANPIADVTLVERSAKRGWPFITTQTLFASQLDTKLLPSARESQRAAIEATAQRAISVAKVGRTTTEHSTQVAAWIFASAAWWLLLTCAIALALMPLRFARFMYRATRTRVRQGRIDRSHCPNCGYNSRESRVRGICPECGSRLYERPEY